MKWFLAGEALTFDIEILVNGVPTQPDAGTISFSVRDQSGAVIAGLDKQPLAVLGTTASISVPEDANTLATSAEPESRFLTLSYLAGGQSRQQRAAYSLHPFLPLQASADDVRSMLGVAADELSDDDIELVGAYYDLVAVQGETFREAFTASSSLRMAANSALAAQAALDAIPSLQLRIFQSRTSENSTFARFVAVDFEKLRADLRDAQKAKLDTAMATSDSTIPNFFTVSSPTDPVTNS